MSNGVALLIIIAFAALMIWSFYGLLFPPAGEVSVVQTGHCYRIDNAFGYTVTRAHEIPCQ